MSDTKTINDGDKFTIDGYGKSPRGHVVLNGKSVKTGRKMRVKTLFKFRCESMESEKPIEPAIIPRRMRKNRKKLQGGPRMRINALFELAAGNFRELEKRIESDYNTDSPL